GCVVLEQVALDPGPQGRDDIRVFRVHRQRDDLDARRRLGHLAGGVEPVQLGHRQVEHRHVRAQGLRALDGVVPVGGLADDLELLTLEQRTEPLTDELVIVDQQHTHRHRARLRPSDAPTGSREAPPRRHHDTTRRIAGTSSVDRLFFRTKASAPLSSAAFRYASSPWNVTMMILVSGSSAFARRTASRPPSRGIAMSIKMTSGRNSRASLTASSPSPASPMTLAYGS